MTGCGADPLTSQALLIRPALAFALSVTLAALVLAGGCSSSSAPPSVEAPAAGHGSEGGDGIRRSPVVAGRPARVFVMAGFGANCESLAAPAITVTTAPTKGSVSFKPGQETTVSTSATGTCIGSRVRGTGIYYTARPGETGSDTFAIEAELGGDVTRRSFSVTIAE